MMSSFCPLPSPSKVQRMQLKQHRSRSVVSFIPLLLCQGTMLLERFTGIECKDMLAYKLPRTYLQYCVLQLEAALQIMQIYLLISTKLNISVISIRISEDHYGSNLGTEIGALLVRKKFANSIKYSRLLLLVVLVTWPYAPLTIVPRPSHRHFCKLEKIYLASYIKTKQLYFPDYFMRNCN